MQTFPKRGTWLNKEKAPQVQELLQENPKITKQAIADELGIGVASVYRILQETKN